MHYFFKKSNRCNMVLQRWFKKAFINNVLYFTRECCCTAPKHPQTHSVNPVTIITECSVCNDIELNCSIGQICNKEQYLIRILLTFLSWKQKLCLINRTMINRLLKMSSSSCKNISYWKKYWIINNC